MKNNSDSKEKILTAASRLFQTKGYNATGLNEILKESESPKGSLYYYFPNGKDELALEAIKLSSQFIQTGIKNALAKYSNPIEAIQYNIKCIIESLEEGNSQNISIGLLALETHLNNEPLREACKEAFWAIENIYAEKLIKNGLSEEVAQEMSSIILAMIEGAITLSVTQKNYLGLKAVSKQISVLLEHYFSSK